jgi:hypothetical protein
MDVQERFLIDPSFECRWSGVGRRRSSKALASQELEDGSRASCMRSLQDGIDGW